MIQQCNAGLVAYDLGATEEGLALVQGAWRTAADRLGPGDRETLVRRTMLAQLQLARGELAEAGQGILADLELELNSAHPGTPWVPVRRTEVAWLSGVAALTPDTARRLAFELVDAFDGRGIRAAAGLDFLTAAVLAGQCEDLVPGTDPVTDAKRAVVLHGRAAGAVHPRTLLAKARLALVRDDLAGHRRPLSTGTGRALLITPDSFVAPGAEGFTADLARHGQPPLDQARPGWEADRLNHLLADDVLDLDPGEQLCWLANAGRLAAVAGFPRAAEVLREAVMGSTALYGPFHPWTLLRAAAAAIAENDPAALRQAITAPQAI